MSKGIGKKTYRLWATSTEIDIDLGRTVRDAIDALQMAESIIGPDARLSLECQSDDGCFAGVNVSASRTMTPAERQEAEAAEVAADAARKAAYEERERDEYERLRRKFEDGQRRTAELNAQYAEEIDRRGARLVDDEGKSESDVTGDGNE